MPSYLWLRPLSYRLLGRPARRASATRPAGSSRRRVPPCLEMLEDRITPATDQTFAPTTFADDGSANSLRGAIIASNSDGFTIPDHTDTIQLKAGTYTLNKGQLSINAENHNLIIQGQGTTGPNATIIQQTVADRVFLIDDGNGNPEKIIFKDLVIEGGNAQVDGQEGTNIAAGGGILAKSGLVTLSNVVVQSNAARASAGNSAQGGGIYMINGADQFNASLTIQNSIIKNNGVFGGAGGDAEGGGVFGTGPFTISISNSTLSDNTATGGNNSNGDGGGAGGGGVCGTFCGISISNSSVSNNTVTGGSGAKGNGGIAAGGGVFGNLSDISISHSVLTNNTVTGGSTTSGNGGLAAGGDVAAREPSGVSHSLTIAHSSLVNNHVVGGNSSAGSGGSAEGGSVFGNCSTTLTSCALTGNTLTGGNGTVNTTVIGTNSVSNNSSVITPGDIGGMAAGGGIWAAGTTVITTCDLSGNILSGGNGTLNTLSANFAGDVGGEAQGGGAAIQSASATITQSTFLNNQVNGGNGNYGSGSVAGSIGGSASGGGIYVNASGGAKCIIDMSASTVSGNLVFGGNGSRGGLFKINGNPAIPVPGFASGGGADLEAGSFLGLLNSTIANNNITGGQGGPANPAAGGGGLFFNDKAGAQLVNDTVVGNKANPSPTDQGSTRGGGIDNVNTLPGAVALGNTLLALNGANSGPDFFGAASNANHNLISDADGSSGFSPLDGNLVGTTTNFLNPGIGGLANNGGPTQTIALLAGSPAINAGLNIPQSQTGPFDQRGQGFARVSGGAMDIGAFEFQQQSASVVPPSPVAAPPGPRPASTLHTPSLLSLFDSLLGGVQTMNSDGTVTVIDRFFGIPLLVATYDSSGNLVSVTLFGINVTFLFA